MSKHNSHRSLDDQLLRWQLPPLSVEERNQFAHRTVLAIRRRLRTDSDHDPRSLWQLGRWWAAGACAVGIAMLLTVFALKPPPRESAAQSPALTTAEALSLWRGVKQLFPENLAAIEIRNGDSTLALSNGPLAGNAPPVLVRLCWRGTCRTFLTVSGQSINAFGLKFEVIEDAEGGVIVLSEHSAWTRAEAAVDLADFAIDARLLVAHQL